MYNPITIQFIHRSLAYLILLLIIVWTVKAFRSNDFYFNKIKWLPLFLACIQVGLGISAVLTSTKIVAHRWGIFEWMAQLHQVVAMLLFLSLVTIFYMLRNNDSKQRVVNIDTRIIK
jgi:cytochrome c oxidase assembly protein subunit 15